MSWDYQFVDRLTADATVRLDLKSQWFVEDETEFPPPELRRASAMTLMADGEQYPAAAYGNRMLNLVLVAKASGDPDAVAAAMQAVQRELDRPTNFLRYRPGTSAPVFFKTFRAGPENVRWSAALQRLTASIPAEPFAVGLKETIGPVTVFNDPATPGGDLNSNPYFEAEGASAGGSNPGFENGTTVWTATSGTITASQDFVKVGAWSGKLTANGGSNPRAMMSQSATIVTAGEQYTISGWLYAPSALPSTAAITIQWYTAGGAFLSQNPVTVTLTPGVWTYLEGSFTAPATAERAARQFSMNGTPTAGTLLYGDDIQIRVAQPANWTALGGTVVRSTAQFHEGVASMLLTPDGVSSSAQARSENLPASVGVSYRASAWVQSTVTRSVNIAIMWRDAGLSVVSTSLSPAFAVSAGVWTLLEMSAVCPAGATLAQFVPVSMGSTPPASNTVYIDEARLRLEGAGNAMYVDLTGVKGDVETPLRITVSQAGLLVDEDQMSAFAVRRRGTVGQTPFLLQAEAMTQGVDTSTQSAPEDASGGGSRWSRTSFATVAASSQSRLSVATWPTGNTPDVRGRYRVFARIRTTVDSDEIYAQLRWGLGFASAGNQEVSVGRTNGTGYTGWKFADLGLISFPSGADPGVDGLTGATLNARGQFVTVEARRQTGSGALDWDYLLFVPADDRLGVIAWGDIALPSGSVVIDGSTETIYPVTSGGVVYGGGRPPSITGWPVASPGVTNRLYWLRSVGPLGADIVNTSTDLLIEYSPKYLYARPVAS